MQIVINIDDAVYKRAMVYKGEQFPDNDDLLGALITAVANGTPLPKGHGQLKDTGVMINKLCTQEASELFGNTTCAEILDFVNSEKPILEADRSEES